MVCEYVFSYQILVCGICPKEKHVLKFPWSYFCDSFCRLKILCQLVFFVYNMFIAFIVFLVYSIVVCVLWLFLCSIILNDLIVAFFLPLYPELGASWSAEKLKWIQNEWVPTFFIMFLIQWFISDQRYFEIFRVYIF